MIVEAEATGGARQRARKGGGKWCATRKACESGLRTEEEEAGRSSFTEKENNKKPAQPQYILTAKLKYKVMKSVTMKMVNATLLSGWHTI